ncbi:hypothetical protein M3Y97_00327100 [Aphelenchoides bicaudatus]|nr:hypothetical protein M3Y97_00327100 [Aphelenchoides bicaudatus]
MTSQKLGVFGAAKDEEAIIAELREFFEPKDVKLAAPTTDLFANVKMFTEAVEKLAATLNEKEVELLMNAIFNLSITLTVEQSAQFVQLVCKIFKSNVFTKGSGWNSHAGAAVRVLSNFFHLYSDRPEIQRTTFLTLLEIAGAAGITKFVDVSLATVEKYFVDWNLDVEKKREVLRELHKALVRDNRTNLAFEVMMALLKTYTAVDADKAKDDARECVNTAIADPNSFSVDHLLRLSAVQSLEKSDSKIHQLLMLFATGKLADYRKFVAENTSFVNDQLKVDQVALEKKFKMLTLISLAEQQSIIPLSVLSSELEIKDAEELEEFLIDAIQIDAVKGKVNEQRGEFVVSSFQYRTFGRPQWELLQKRLSSLLKNLKQTSNNLNKLVIEEAVE